MLCISKNFALKFCLAYSGKLPEELNNQLFRKLKSIVEVQHMTPDQRLEYELIDPNLKQKNDNKEKKPACSGFRCGDRRA